MARRSAKPSVRSAGADAPASGANDVTTGWVTVLLGLAISGFLFWKNHDRGVILGFYEYNLLNIAFVLWVPLIVGMLFLRREPADIGFATGDLGKGMLAALACFVLFCPVLYFFGQNRDAQSYYIGHWMNSLGGSGAVISVFGDGRGGIIGGRIVWEKLVYHEVIMGFYMFAWEYYHRGFLLNGFLKIMPDWGAVLLQAALFTALHYGKPLAETISSFPGAILMALLAIRFRSFLPCFLLHWLVSAGFDFSVLYHHFK